MKLAARQVELNRTGCYLKFDYTGAAYRIALYLPRYAVQRDPAGKPGRVQVGEHRITIERRSLYDALTCVFAEASDEHSVEFDARTVEHYMRSTAWGRELP